MDDPVAKAVERARLYVAAGVDCVCPIGAPIDALPRLRAGGSRGLITVGRRPGGPSLVGVGRGGGVMRITFGPGLQRRAAAALVGDHWTVCGSGVAGDRGRSAVARGPGGGRRACRVPPVRKGTRHQKSARSPTTTPPTRSPLPEALLGHPRLPRGPVLRRSTASPPRPGQLRSAIRGRPVLVLRRPLEVLQKAAALPPSLEKSALRQFLQWCLRVGAGDLLGSASQPSCRRAVSPRSSAPS
ncbi:hypothetical protein [Streptomyces sp. KL116D]|uniref:hypothetical protein n=1 Tax=Streptomyces sp. KL116D TaxID=3045152 RepID=UPI0035591143